MESISETGGTGGGHSTPDNHPMGIGRSGSRGSFGRPMSNSNVSPVSLQYMPPIPMVNSLGSMPRISSHNSIPSFNSQGSMERINSQGSIPTPLSPGSCPPGVWEQEGDERNIMLSYFLEGNQSPGQNPLVQNSLGHAGASHSPIGLKHLEHQAVQNVDSLGETGVHTLTPTTPAVHYYSSASTKREHSSDNSYSQFSSASAAAAAAASAAARSDPEDQDPSTSASVHQGLQIINSNQMLPPPPKLRLLNPSHGSAGSFTSQSAPAVISYHHEQSTLEHQQQHQLKQQQQQQHHQQPHYLNSHVQRQTSISRQQATEASDASPAQQQVTQNGLTQNGQDVQNLGQGEDTHLKRQRQREQQQRHVEWLRQMNDLAMRARQQPPMSMIASAATSQNPVSGDGVHIQVDASSKSSFGHATVPEHLQPEHHLASDGPGDRKGISTNGVLGIKQLTASRRMPEMQAIAMNNNPAPVYGMQSSAITGPSAHVQIAPMPGHSTVSAQQRHSQATHDASHLSVEPSNSVSSASGISSCLTVNAAVGASGRVGCVEADDSGNSSAIPGGTDATKRATSAVSASQPSSSNVIHKSGTISRTPVGGSSGGSIGTTESDDRRARRLARNRESARQSRRRKKENLMFLGEKVNNLKGLIEEERRFQINGMERGLMGQYIDGVKEQASRFCSADRVRFATGIFSEGERENVWRDKLAKLVREFSPNSTVRRGVTSFQYGSLRQNLLPHHHQFFLWLSLQRDGFFIAGKESRTKMSGRVSSKQIGEEITLKHDASASVTRSTVAIGAGAAAFVGKPSNNVLSCSSGAIAKFWPLLCFELTLSADQEERFRVVQGHFRSREKEDMAMNRKRLSAAVLMAMNLKKLLLQRGHSVSYRRESVLLDVLTPVQSAQYLKWIVENRERCRSIRGDVGSLPVTGTSLDELCVHLDRTLNIDSEGHSGGSGDEMD